MTRKLVKVNTGYKYNLDKIHIAFGFMSKGPINPLVRGWVKEVEDAIAKASGKRLKLQVKIDKNKQPIIR